jgi:16S rRNA U1498 N3-methylase RsmE
MQEVPGKEALAHALGIFKELAQKLAELGVAEIIALEAQALQVTPAPRVMLDHHLPV